MKLESLQTKVTGTSTPPADFNEGGKEHRRAVLGNTALITVLALAEKVDPKLLGIEVSTRLLWTALLVGHFYFFAMWRITSPVENDSENRFWNLGGLFRQAFLRGTKDFPGKRKAQHFLIRAVPIWAFLLGLAFLFWNAAAAFK